MSLTFDLNSSWIIVNQPGLAKNMVIITKFYSFVGQYLIIRKFTLAFSSILNPHSSFRRWKELNRKPYDSVERIHVLALLLSGTGTLGKLFHLLAPQFP